MIYKGYKIATFRGYWYAEKGGLAAHCALTRKAIKKWIDEVTDDADFAEDEMPDERKGWSRQEWDEAQAEDRAGWEA